MNWATQDSGIAPIAAPRLCRLAREVVANCRQVPLLPGRLDEVGEPDDPAIRPLRLS
jgi:hypothetical protein